MEVVIAEPVYNEKISIKYVKGTDFLVLNYNDSGMNYLLKIYKNDIPLPGFDISTFNSLLTDIVNKKSSSEYNVTIKDSQCFVNFNMVLEDYLKTEYRFVLVLKPVNKSQLLTMDIDELKKKNEELSEEVKKNTRDIVELREMVGGLDLKQ